MWLGVALPLLLLLVLFAPPAIAQSPQAAQATSIYDEQKPVIDGFKRKAEELAQRVRRFAEDDARLVEVRNELEDLSRQILASGVAFRPRLNEINARLEQIGPAPGDGQPQEPAIIADERAGLVREKAEINALIGEAENLSIRVTRLIDEIATIRRDLFTQTLSKRYDVLTALDAETLADFRREMNDLYRAFSAWLRFVTTFKLQSVLFATLLALGAALVLHFGGRRAFGEMMDAEETRQSPSYLSRLSVAFWSTLLPSAAFVVFLGATYFFFDYFGVLRRDIAEIMATLFQVVAIIYFVNRLVGAALSPRLPQWRLVPVASRAATVLAWLAWLTAVTAGLDFLMNKVTQVLGSPLSLTIAKSLAAALIVGVLLIAISLIKPFDGEDGRRKPWPAVLKFLFLALGIGLIAAALLGYIGFARFLSQQIVVTGAILATMYIGFLSAGAITDEGAFESTAMGRFVRMRFKMEGATLDQLGLAVSILTYALIIFAGVPLILLQWGFQWGDITTWAYRLAHQITIGSVSFSLVGILSGVLVFVLGYFLTRGFQSWLDGSVMARGRVDAGVRNSIRTGVGYAGIALAGLIGISAAGIDLSNLALVAGALSLGIGFGLQNVVSNFVSGLILLAERPFKAGDWIVAGNVTGTVKRISVRATEIETFQRQTVILPNSELINAAVGNWTHKNKLGRVEIKVGVAYGSDVRRVHGILLGLAQEHPLVLKNPEPFVHFANFGDSSLDFEIRFFLSDILNGVRVQNDIRFAIIDAFEREGIEIPFPQRDLHIRTGGMAAGAGEETRAAETIVPPPIIDEAIAATPAAPVIRIATKPRRRRSRPDPDDPT
jgi:small-conductance mechanosensitive channel